MNRRVQDRVTPRTPWPVGLTLACQSFNGFVWDVSPTGARILFDQAVHATEQRLLQDFLGFDPRLRLGINGKQLAASLVWYGLTLGPAPAARPGGLVLGIEFAESLPFSALPGSEKPAPLPFFRVRHRSSREPRVALALRNLYAAIASRGFSLDAALHILCEKIRELIEVESVDFWALEDGRLALRAQAGSTRLKVGARLRQGPGTLLGDFAGLKARMQKGEQLFSNDLRHSRIADHPWVRRLGAQSAMVIPVYGPEVDFGMLVLSHAQNPYAFGPAQQLEAETFANQAALFFEKSTMIQDLREWASFLSAANRIVLALHERLEVDRVLEVICKETRQLFQVDLATIFLRCERGYTQRAASGMSLKPRRIETPEEDLPETRLMEAGEAFFINDFQSHRIGQCTFARGYMGSRPARSLMVVPIREDKKVLGVLALGDRNDPARFTNRDLEKGKLLGEQAAQAIINAHLYERLDQSKRIIRQQDRFHILGELAGVVSHEIRNALVPLRAVVDLLPQRYADADFRNWYVETVREEMERMHELVNELSRFRNGERRAAESIDPEGLLRSVVDLLEPEAKSRQILLECEVPPALTSILVVGNEIRQVLMNLILNAIQAVEEKGLVRVGVRAVSPAGGTLFWVSDTGPGIPPEDLEKIFDPLYTTKENGSGLGLAVVRDLVESHGGTISVDSVQGKGTTFTVSLPAEQAGALAASTQFRPEAHPL